MGLCPVFKQKLTTTLSTKRAFSSHSRQEIDPPLRTKRIGVGMGYRKHYHRTKVNENQNSFTIRRGDF